MHGHRPLTFFATLALLAATLATLAVAPAAAATRQPLRAALMPVRPHVHAFDAKVRPRPAALRAMARQSARRYAAAGEGLAISSTHYGPAEVESVAATLRSLDHGPELSDLSVYVATRGELVSVCGATVVACYVPAEHEMVVSGADRPVAGVSREFAIAHEYGHHIANGDPGGAGAAVAAGTLRWATYERVCQLTRRGHLYPGNQGAHYWEDPEEAFAQAYAHLNRPAERLRWQYSGLLQPTPGSLAKIHADVAHPRRGRVEATWTAQVDTTRSRRIRTPLDGPVTIALQAGLGAGLTAVLRDPERGRALVHTAAAPGGSAHLAYENCGNASLELEVRAPAAPTAFQATIARP